ncbi:MAG: nicotinate phosphoribosyltransferase [Microcoleaceae cyanobacterium]
MNPLPEPLLKPDLKTAVEDQELCLAPEDYSLLTDLYQLTMAVCYTGENLDQAWASFELFTRRLPNGFGYLIAMGLAQALDYLEKFCFSSAQIQALQSTGIFCNAPERFWQLLTETRFMGDVWAVPEGTAVFANEPLLRIEAPLWQAQLVETYLLNTLNYQTLIATRAARLRDVAGAQATLLEFGTRRAFSPQASIWAARAALAGGLDGTSNVLAALKLGRNPVGTMAHSLVMAVSALEGSEDEAFAAFHRYFPGAPLLIDTYDTVAATRRLAEQMGLKDIELTGVRLDSGDLVQLSKTVRSLLPDIPIFASGDIDEWEIARLKAAGAEIDGYGLGTKLVSGSPVNGVYKLVEIAGRPVMKEASGKVTYPGRKQIVRTFKQGQVQSDDLVLMNQTSSVNLSQSNGQSVESIELLQQVMQQGRRLQPIETLHTIAQRAAGSVGSLPSDLRRLDHPTGLEINISPELQRLTSQTRHRLGL